MCKQCCDENFCDTCDVWWVISWASREVKRKSRLKKVDEVFLFNLVPNTLHLRLYRLVTPVPTAQVVERLLREREVAGSKSGRAIPKAFKMVPVATLLGAQHYKASTGFSPSLLTQLTLHKKQQQKNKKQNKTKQKTKQQKKNNKIKQQTKNKKKKKTKKKTNPQHLVHRNPSDVPLGG